MSYYSELQKLVAVFSVSSQPTPHSNARMLKARIMGQFTIRNRPLRVVLRCTRSGVHSKKYRLSQSETSKIGRNSWSFNKRKCLITKNVHVKYESPFYYGSKVIANVKVLRYVGQSHRLKILAWTERPYHKEYKIDVEHESPITNASKVINKIIKF